VLASYEGQPKTCYGYGETGHLCQVCPKRRRLGVAATKEPTASWADIAANGTRSTRFDHEGKWEEAAQQNEQEDQAGESREEKG